MHHLTVSPPTFDYPTHRFPKLESALDIAELIISREARKYDLDLRQAQISFNTKLINGVRVRQLVFHTPSDRHDNMTISISTRETSL